MGTCILQELLALQQETKTLRDQIATLKQQKLEAASSNTSGGPSLPLSSTDPVPFGTNYFVLLSSITTGGSALVFDAYYKTARHHLYKIKVFSSLAALQAEEAVLRSIHELDRGRHVVKIEGPPIEGVNHPSITHLLHSDTCYGLVLEKGHCTLRDLLAHKVWGTCSFLLVPWPPPLPTAHTRDGYHGYLRDGPPPCMQEEEKHGAAPLTRLALTLSTTYRKGLGKAHRRLDHRDQGAPGSHPGGPRRRTRVVGL
jgi:hypothetical protein